LYVFIFVFFVFNYRSRGLSVMILLALTFLISDQLSSSVIKPLVQRIRPCNQNGMSDMVHLLVNCGSGYSFTSTHAANHFAIAMFLIALLYKRFRWIIPVGLFWAFSVSYAQIYVGLHFPMDIVGGGILGLAIGFIVGQFCKKYFFDVKLVSSVY